MLVVISESKECIEYYDVRPQIPESLNEPIPLGSEITPRKYGVEEIPIPNRQYDKMIKVYNREIYLFNDQTMCLTILGPESTHSVVPFESKSSSISPLRQLMLKNDNLWYFQSSNKQLQIFNSYLSNSALTLTQSFDDSFMGQSGFDVLFFDGKVAYRIQKDRHIEVYNTVSNKLIKIITGHKAMQMYYFTEAEKFLFTVEIKDGTEIYEWDSKVARSQPVLF